MRLYTWASRATFSSMTGLQMYKAQRKLKLWSTDTQQLTAKFNGGTEEKSSLILRKTKRTYMGKQSVQDCFGCGRQATLALQLISTSLWCLLHWCPCAGSGYAFCTRGWQQQLSSPSSSCPTLNHKATPLMDSPPTCLLIWVILQLQSYHLSSWSLLSRPSVSFLFPSTPYGRTAGKHTGILMTDWTRYHRHMPAFCPFHQHSFWCPWINLFPFVPHSYQS